MDKESPVPKTELTLSFPSKIKMESQLREIEKSINEGIDSFLRSKSRSINLYIHKPTGRVAAKIIDNISKRVIMEIPPQEVLNLYVRIQRLLEIMSE